MSRANQEHEGVAMQVDAAEGPAYVKYFERGCEDLHRVDKFGKGAAKNSLLAQFLPNTYKNESHIKLDNPLFAVSQHESTARDLYYEGVVSDESDFIVTLKRHLLAIDKIKSDAISNPNNLDEDTLQSEINKGLEVLVNNIFGLVFLKINEEINAKSSEDRDKVSLEGGDKVFFQAWQERLKKRISDNCLAYYNSTNPSEEDNSVKFFNFVESLKLLYGAIFYKCNEDFLDPVDGFFKCRPRSIQDRKTGLLTVINAADLNACEGGDNGDLEKIIRSERDISIESDIVDQLQSRFFIHAGNERHFGDMLRYMATGKSGVDASELNPVADMTMKDLADLYEILTLRSGDLMVEYIAKKIFVILKEASDLTLRDKDRDNYTFDAKLDEVINRRKLRGDKYFEVAFRDVRFQGFCEEISDSISANGKYSINKDDIFDIVYQAFDGTTLAKELSRRMVVEMKKAKSGDGKDFWNKFQERIGNVTEYKVEFDKFYKNEEFQKYLKLWQSGQASIDEERIRKIALSIFAEKKICLNRQELEKLDVLVSFNIFSLKASLKIPSWLRDEAARVFAIDGVSSQSKEAEDLFNEKVTKTLREYAVLNLGGQGFMTRVLTARDGSIAYSSEFSRKNDRFDRDFWSVLCSGANYNKIMESLETYLADSQGQRLHNLEKVDILAFNPEMLQINQLLITRGGENFGFGFDRAAFYKLFQLGDLRFYKTLSLESFALHFRMYDDKNNILNGLTFRNVTLFLEFLKSSPDRFGESQVFNEQRLPLYRDSLISDIAALILFANINRDRAGVSPFFSQLLLYYGTNDAILRWIKEGVRCQEGLGLHGFFSRITQQERGCYLARHDILSFLKVIDQLYQGSSKKEKERGYEVKKAFLLLPTYNYQFTDGTSALVSLLEKVFFDLQIIAANSVQEFNEVLAQIKKSFRVDSDPVGRALFSSLLAKMHKNSRAKSVLARAITGHSEAIDLIDQYLIPYVDIEESTIEESTLDTHISDAAGLSFDLNRILHRAMSLDQSALNQEQINYLATCRDKMFIKSIKCASMFSCKTILLDLATRGGEDLAMRLQGIAANFYSPESSFVIARIFSSAPYILSDDEYQNLLKKIINSGDFLEFIGKYLISYKTLDNGKVIKLKKEDSDKISEFIMDVYNTLIEACENEEFPHALDFLDNYGYLLLAADLKSSNNEASGIIFRQIVNEIERENDISPILERLKQVINSSQDPLAISRFLFWSYSDLGEGLEFDEFLQSVVKDDNFAAFVDKFLLSSSNLPNGLGICLDDDESHEFAAFAMFFFEGILEILKGGKELSLNQARCAKNILLRACELEDAKSCLYAFDCSAHGICGFEPLEMQERIHWLRTAYKIEGDALDYRMIQKYADYLAYDKDTESSALEILESCVLHYQENPDAIIERSFFEYTENPSDENTVQSERASDIIEILQNQIYEIRALQKSGLSDFSSDEEKEGASEEASVASLALPLGIASKRAHDDSQEQETPDRGPRTPSAKRKSEERDQGREK